MPYTRLRYHFVFATKKRARWIWPEVEEFLYPVLVRLTERAGGHTIRIGGVEDHVHTICALKPKISPSDFIERIKSESSQAVRGRFKNLWGFKWQIGYGAFSLNPHDMDRVIAYVENQKQHHRRGDLWAVYEKMTDRVADSNGDEREHLDTSDAARSYRLGRQPRHIHKEKRGMWGACVLPWAVGCPSTEREETVSAAHGGLRLA
jgi:putative transposase